VPEGFHASVGGDTPKVELGLSHEAPLDTSQSSHEDLCKLGLQQFSRSVCEGLRIGLEGRLQSGYYWIRAVSGLGESWDSGLASFQVFLCCFCSRLCSFLEAIRFVFLRSILVVITTIRYHCTGFVSFHP
jgi:hypothetical protein